MSLTKAVWVFAALVLCSGGASAQDLSGDWQGALGAAPRQLRLILHIEKGDGAAWKATFASIDQDPDRGAALPVDDLTVRGATFGFSIAALRGTYSGTIAADGNSIDGTWRQGQPLPLSLVRATPETAWKDPSPHSVRFVTVDSNVKLEVLDWAGPQAGNVRTLVLVPGAGNTAHIFDAIAPKLAARYRVVGITRRGFGASSAPSSGYAADRLGDDVLAVVEALSISRPVLVGHSLGGEELSSIGSRYPDKVAGLVYLDAGYSYAFYAPGLDPVPEPAKSPLPPPMPAIFDGMQRYTKIPPPILAIYALPHDPGTTDAAARAHGEALDVKGEALVKAFEAALPNAHVVRLPHANHFLFLSNEADVLREMDAFLSRLK
ncbi:MAG TPA: alpha/beta hydrolase [Gammaproteobacteria bacterium]|nr:alpha/beta hydrolase [Gammaproteobacteria bacterium]